MQKDTVLRKNPNMVTRVIEDETVLLPILKSSEEINCIYTLNRSASRVWGLINGKRTLCQIKEQVLNDFEATKEEVDKEMAALIDDLREIKAVAGQAEKGARRKGKIK